MTAFEKLGVFYLGREVDPATGETTDRPLLYDDKDLTTHAVCVGMTGSGKTGLCLALLEEAAIDGIPAILIDPKGDLGNRLLTFPELRPADFLPWIDEAAAMRSGRTVDEQARKTATAWSEGLAEWGQDGDRIRRLQEACDVAIWTPGGGRGLPLRVLRSFEPPPADVLADADARGEKVQGLVQSLLVLLDVDPDPVTSREAILLATILERAWTAGRALDLAGLIREVQSPPFATVGVLDLESFFPAKDRFGLAMRLNHLLAAPGFAAWREGEPLDVDTLLRGPDGRPRHSIVSIAHLDDRERMFFVTLLLHEMVAWMRRQPGTGSLRALLYMDEVFGFFPPSAEPPSKKPMLTLLKQARACGLGVVLATQNPVDLDYKGLSNAGTWFVGRLQTERDRERLLDGLEGVRSAGGNAPDRRALAATLAGLDSRVFLMHDVHEDHPVVFRTRWVMSYLRGPLTSAQIGTLMDPRRAAATARTAAAPPAAPPSAVASAAAGGASEPPVLPPGVPVAWLPPAGLVAEGPRVWRPALLGRARLHWVRAAAGLDEWRETARLALLDADPGPDPWADALTLATPPSPGASVPSTEPATWDEVPAAARTARPYRAWGKALAAHLHRTATVSVFACAQPKEQSSPGESEAAFRGRLAARLGEDKDRALEKLRARYAAKASTLEDRIRRARQRVEREQAQHADQKLQTAISVGATVLGALFGRKVASVGTVGRATRAARGASRISREQEDVARAQETLEADVARLEALEAELAAEIEALAPAFDPADLEIEEIPVAPRKTDLQVSDVVLAWTPWRRRSDGALLPDFE